MRKQAAVHPASVLGLVAGLLIILFASIEAMSYSLSDTGLEACLLMFAAGIFLLVASAAIVLWPSLVDPHRIARIKAAHQEKLMIAAKERDIVFSNALAFTWKRRYPVAIAMIAISAVAVLAIDFDYFWMALIVCIASGILAYEVAGTLACLLLVWVGFNDVHVGNWRSGFLELLFATVVLFSLLEISNGRR